MIEAANFVNADNVFNPRFHVFLYEQHETNMGPARSVGANIARTFGTHCDAYLTFFKDRVGQGTLDEFEIFEKKFRVHNLACKLWWARIHSEDPFAPVKDFVGRLYSHSTEMKSVGPRLRIESPEDLKARVVLRLMSLTF